SGDNGSVNVDAKDLGTGKRQQIKIIASSGLSPQEIERMIQEAEQFSTEDKRKKQIADLKNMADGLLYTTEKSLEEYSSMLTEDDIRDIKEDLESLKAVYDSSDVDKIRAAIQRLEGSSAPTPQTLYPQATPA